LRQIKKSKKIIKTNVLLLNQQSYLSSFVSACHLSFQPAHSLALSLRADVIGIEIIIKFALPKQLS